MHYRTVTICVQAAEASEAQMHVGGLGGLDPPPRIRNTLARLGALAKFWQKTCF